MAEWMEKTESLTLKGQIAVPYSWWVGATGSRFLIALRDDKKIMGTRCGSCGKVYVPPRKNCGDCFRDIEEWVELGNEGEVASFSIVRFPFKLHPAKTPFAYALIKLDGADVSLLHIVTGKLDALKRGSRVRAKFREERTGHIMDIESFEILS
jgi:uncharacterized OB-fold protein